MALPATKINELFNELSSILQNDTTLDEFSLLRYQREISTIKKIEYSRGLVLDACLMAISGNTPALIKIITEFITLESVETMSYNNMIWLLSMIGKIIEAYAVSTAAVQNFPNDLRLATEHMRLAVVLEDTDTVQTLKDKFPEPFKDTSLDFLSVSEEDELDEVIAINILFGEDCAMDKLKSFSPREKRRLEELLHGVDV